ncbi:hypothetical protein D9757_013889 [Collybiopsis confluens]|uniref:Uncharacterized protein n=1 Tax=Collybiopsis confluens TaxID=2823264 RepID=A0A8H5FPU3_9AGAR|nr:hypothetical protein D9757_013889 [Collybiopsis confluens]
MDLSTRTLFDYSPAGVGGSSSSSHVRNRLNAPEIDMSTFQSDGFSDFTLDLSCLSNPSSPASPPPISLTSSDNVMNILPAPSPSSPLLPPLDESVLLAGGPGSDTSPSPKASPMTRATSMMRMSLPAMKYIGRGTPVDPGRRFEWGGRKSEEVTEDGRLFSTERGEERTLSLDSHYYTHHQYRHHRRSYSIDWPQQVTPEPRTLSPLHMDIDSTLENHASPPTFLEPLPESSKIQVRVDSDPTEWESVMKTVLGSSGLGSTSVSPPSAAAAYHRHSTGGDGEATSITPSRRDSQGPIPGLPQHPNGLDIVLGLNSALDLGLGLGKGMNFFDLGLIPDSGRDTPSVYSSAHESPENSRPASVIVRKSNGNARVTTSEREEEEEGADADEHPLERRPEEDEPDSGSTTAEAISSPLPTVIPFEPKAMHDVGRVHWWRMAVSKLRKVPKLIKPSSRL